MGEIEDLPKKIYVHVHNLEKGNYELNILNKNKLLKRTNFKK